MARRDNASLQEQMARLHQAMSSRDERRQQNAEKRHRGADDDPYSDRPTKKPPNATGGTALGGNYYAAAAAMAAVAQASALTGPRLVRCDVCNATFSGDADMQQHLQGPTHEKALVKAEAERRRNEALGNMRWAAENASAAAAWQGSKYEAVMRDDPAAPAGLANNGGSGGNGGAKHSRPNPHSNQGGRRPPPRGAAKAEPVPQRTTLSHADMVAAATKDNGPLSIGGWVPPTTFAAPAGHGTAALQGDVEAVQYDSDDDGDDDGAEPRQADPDANGQEEEAREEKPGGAAQEAGGLVGYGSSSDSDSGSDAPAERDRPVSFF